MKQIGLLFRMEFRRLLTPVNYALPLIFLVLTGLVGVITARFSPSISVPAFLRNVSGDFLLQFGPALLGLGMLSYDVKEHWARTVLMRPVTREQYLLARIGAVFAAFIILFLFAGLLPIPIASLIADKPVIVDVWNALGVFVLISGQALLLIILLAMLSCWLPGITNLVILAIWAILSQLLGTFIDYKYWDVGFLVIFKEFLFPSGFTEAAMALLSGGPGIWSGIFWGMAAGTGFLAITIWAFNRMNVESGSD